MKITKKQLRQIIREEIMREALNPEEVDWQRIRTMRPGDINDLPPEHQNLAVTMMSTRDTAGRKVGQARWDAQSAKIFEIIDALRDSLSKESWTEISREIFRTSDEFTRDIAYNLIDEINKDIKNMSRMIGYESTEQTGTWRPSWVQPEDLATSDFWPGIKDWAFREAMSSRTVSDYNKKTGKNLFAGSHVTRTPVGEEAKQIYAGAVENMRRAAAQEKKKKSWF